ncbi:MAG: hypothetical protein GTO63_26780 [Anaerolineae bacterium]|nr:hypothetical protein [Anaerolineae bacterium]
MLSYEAIGVLAILYCFFMYGTLRAIRAKKTVRREVPKRAPVATQPTSQTSEQPTR